MPAQRQCDKVNGTDGSLYARAVVLMGQDVYYAVARSPMLEGSAIYKQWSTAYPVCIDSETGQPYPGARFKKFTALSDAKAFIQTFAPTSTPELRTDDSTTCDTKVFSDRGQRRRGNVIGPQIHKRPHLVTEPLSSATRQSLGNLSAYEIEYRSPTESPALSSRPMEDSSSVVHVYTDGACVSNGQFGAKAGYGVYFGENDPRNAYGSLSEEGSIHTNQRAELVAILRALQIVQHDPRKLVIYSDSKYSMQCFESWIPKWRLNGFQTAKNTAVKNLDVIQAIDSLIQKRGSDLFSFQYVPAHQGVYGNEAADSLARKGVHANGLS